MKGWILYKRNQAELTTQDHGVLRFLSVAKSLKIELEVYKPEQFELVVSPAMQGSILLDGQRVALPDFLLPRLGALTSYFGLALIRHIEQAGIYTCNSSNAIETVRDKLLLSQLLAQANLPAPRTMLVKFPVSKDLVQREIGFPLVIKNISGAQGVGIHLCQSEEGFTDLMELIACQNIHSRIILQEFIEDSHGRDLRVVVLGGKVIGCMQRIAETGFKANCSLGGKAELYPLTPEIERLAVDCARLFNLEIAGIDLLFNKGSFNICEANSSPGFKGMESAGGEDIATSILSYVKARVASRPR